MKRLTIIAMFSLVFGHVFSQVVTGPHYNNFEISENLDITIDTSLVDNIWEIGQPNKTLFDAAFSAPLAIITDTIANYPNNNYSTFQLTIPFGNYDFFPHITMDFRHKLDTDFQEDGGWVEASYDGGNTWANVFTDTIHPTISYVPPSGIYPDTLANGQVAFTGFQNSWYPFEISWDNAGNTLNPSLDSMLVRFVFYSDGNPSSKEGWTLDDIRVLRTGAVIGTQEIQLGSDPEVFPNPATERFFVRQRQGTGQFFITDILGKQVLSGQLQSDNQSVDVNNLKSGIYFVTVLVDNTTWTKEIMKY